MNKNWIEYKKVLEREEEAKTTTNAKFCRLFKVGDMVKFRRKTDGVVQTGDILNRIGYQRRLYIANFKTGKLY